MTENFDNVLPVLRLDATNKKDTSYRDGSLFAKFLLIFEEEELWIGLLLTRNRSLKIKFSKENSIHVSAIHKQQILGNFLSKIKTNFLRNPRFLHNVQPRLAFSLMKISKVNRVRMCKPMNDEQHHVPWERFHPRYTMIFRVGSSTRFKGVHEELRIGRIKSFYHERDATTSLLSAIKTLFNQQRV